jgi:hypothetical protein
METVMGVPKVGSRIRLELQQMFHLEIDTPKGDLLKNTAATPLDSRFAICLLRRALQECFAPK